MCGGRRFHVKHAVVDDFFIPPSDFKSVEGWHAFEAALQDVLDAGYKIELGGDYFDYWLERIQVRQKQFGCYDAEAWESIANA